ncbi:MAG: phosphoribosylanthranilate isomerase [Thermodesulfobacteriaceae bacterium]|nr:phosphoribosylanthranilate isomerase [Thermodesulfobacteriaceae bacterium]
MVRIKICGLKDPEDLELIINRFPIDYVGFVKYPKSPRYVEDLKVLVELVKNSKKVAVFVNPSYEEVKKTLDLGIDLIQLHGDEAPEFGSKIGFERIIKAFRVKGEFLDLEIFKPWAKAYALLLDTYKPGIPGGTGETFDWGIAKKVVSSGYKVFLAGGINPEKVVLAIKEVHPYAVDVSSGVELYPGKKDPLKVKLLIEKVKGC